MSSLRCLVRSGGMCVAVGVLLVLATDSRGASDSRWTVSAGVEAREIRADFSLGSPTAPLDSFRTPYSDGLGNVGLFDGRNAVAYEDGAIPVKSPLAFFPLRPGVAWYRVDDARAQVTRGGSPVRWNGNAMDEIRFHSRGEQFESEAGAAGDDDVVNALTPYVALHHRGCRRGGTDFGCVLKYGFSVTKQESGAKQAASVRRTSTDYTYRYDGAASGSPELPLPIPARNGVVVHDASALQRSQRGNGVFLDRARDPEISESRRVTTFAAVSSAETDITLHELLLGVEASRALGSRASCALIVGPTASILDWRLRASTAWQDEQGTAVVRESARESDVEVLIGCRAALELQLALTRTGRLGLEVHGGYAWVAPFDCDAGNASAEIELSSFTCGVGLRGSL